MEATVATQFETLTALGGGPIGGGEVGDSLRLRAYAPVVLPSRIMHHRPCRPHLDRLRPTTSDNRELWAQNAERYGFVNI